MSEKKYSVKELKLLWKKYRTQKGVRFQQGGIWKTQILNGRVPDVELAKSTRAEHISIHQHMSFPEFIEIQEA